MKLVPKARHGKIFHKSSLPRPRFAQHHQLLKLFHRSKTCHPFLNRPHQEAIEMLTSTNLHHLVIPNPPPPDHILDDIHIRINPLQIHRLRHIQHPHRPAPLRHIRPYFLFYLLNQQVKVIRIRLKISFNILFFSLYL